MSLQVSDGAGSAEEHPCDVNVFDDMISVAGLMWAAPKSSTDPTNSKLIFSHIQVRMMKSELEYFSCSYNIQPHFNERNWF